MTPESSASPRANFELAQKCLIAIRDIADRAVRSLDPEVMGYAIQELTQVLLERTGNDERLFEPVSVVQINDLPKLYAELDFVDGCSHVGAELGMEAITRNVRQCSEATTVGFAQHSHRRAAVGPRARGRGHLASWPTNGCSM